MTNLVEDNRRKIDRLRGCRLLPEVPVISVTVELGHDVDVDLSFKLIPARDRVVQRKTAKRIGAAVIVRIDESKKWTG
ncbi:hypothetical protein GGP80_000199 [Salinibacter ruber]|nr:hypothetical protein [Salinibacter ruber]MBB4061199.1 hypothetical protein [Salinibacter ruber]MBB4069323.1 hypothetical protein [Salinibacter ruber]MCS3750995.1 hypothetical protein [Salinibacter ruber]MCS3757108.1 hypothetical protein [Salinibacter ruber]MCS3934240.1 hypothetical protein [Salinibacter ruber]